MDVLLWDGSSEQFGEINFIPNSLKSDFEEFVTEGLISLNLDSVYFASDSVLGEVDIKLMAQVVTDGPFEIEIFEVAQGCIDSYDFNKLTDKLSTYPKKSRLIANIINSIKELSFLLSLFLDEIFVKGPLAEDVNWLNSELSFSEYFTNKRSFNYLDSCSILRALKENLEKVGTIVQSYTEAKPAEKLAFLASWYLFSSKLASKRDCAHSVLLLHRSLETCFKYWLLEDQQIKLDKNGETIGDKHTYLMDYLYMVKKERSISDDESGSVGKLNELRNFSKYAHGHTCISVDSYEDLNQQIAKLISSDEKISCFYKEITSIFNLSSIRLMIKNYIFDQQYLVKR